MGAIALGRVWEELCGLLWPPRCLACENPPCAAFYGAFCEVCVEALLPVVSPRCPFCGLPFDGAGPDHACGSCRKAPPPFESARAVLQYGGPAAIACLRFKSGRAEMARPLGVILASLSNELPQVDVVVPVPLHRRRLAQRGYNQSALLAGHLARTSGVPLDTNSLVRVRDTVSQVHLDVVQRSKNLQGAFRASERAIRGRRILLVDDVVTTTATCRAASRALKDAGAAQVHVACLLRAT